MRNDAQSDRGRRHALTWGLFLLLLVMSLTAWLASRIRDIDVASASTADLRQDLPERVGGWGSVSILYCQNEQCMGSFLQSELNAGGHCPRCEGRLDQVSLGERNILPPDTIISRRLYHNDREERITVTIVLAGSEQRSIHRPQQCLPAQGFAIERTSRFSVPLEGRAPLQLTLIQARKGASTERAVPKMLMAYWFSGGGHETPDHFQRMAFMAWDNLIHGVRSRWAYVSFQASSSDMAQDAEQRLAEFIRQLYPLLKPTPLPARQ